MTLSRALALLLLTAVICIPVLTTVGCAPPQPQPQVSEEKTEATREIVQEVTIPALDAAAPSRTETATFALG
jgi:hypothetical protein